MNRSILAVSTLALVGAVFAPSAHAQWSSNAASNLKVADNSNEQVQPKIAATPDGGAYISWYDNFLGGYDVYVQRVNAQGVEQWAHNGVLVADRSVSSTVDYSLACDLDGYAVIVFNDSRTVPQQITLQKIAPDGSFVFNGSAGINVGPGSTTSSPPTVCVLADGNYGVIWNNSTVSPINTAMQKVDSHTGALLWNGGAPLLQADWLSPVRPVQASDCQADDVGGMIVLFVRCTGTNCVTSNKQLFTQRYDATGAPVWNAGIPITIFAGSGSIQTGTFPRFIPDGTGGAVYAYYEIGGSRNAYLQHVLGSGALKFAAPIANTGVTAGRIRIGASPAYNRATGEYFMASSETGTPTQTNYTVIVQRYNSSGVILWGNGVPLIAQSATFQASFTQCVPAGDGCLVSWIWQDNTVNGYVYSARISGDATVLWNQQIASQFIAKSRLTGTLASCGDYTMLAWGNGPSGSVDIAVQNVMFDGTIGPGTCPAFSTQPPAMAHPCQGSTMNLTAAATGNSAPCLRWRKNGVALVNGGRIAGATSGTLTITNVRASDAGSYDVVASNTCGNQPSTATVVTICAADYNCDGVLTIADIFDFLAAWFAGNPNADFNRDGSITITDIFDFLAAWFAGC